MILNSYVLIFDGRVSLQTVGGMSPIEPKMGRVRKAFVPEVWETVSVFYSILEWLKVGLIWNVQVILNTGNWLADDLVG